MNFWMFHKGNLELSVSRFELRWYWEHDQLDFSGWVSKQLHQSIMKRSFLKQNTINSNFKVLDEFEIMNISAENLIGFVGNTGETWALQSHAVEVGVRDPGEDVNQIGDLDWQAGKRGGCKTKPIFFFHLKLSSWRLEDFTILTLDLRSFCYQFEMSVVPFGCKTLKSFSCLRPLFFCLQPAMFFWIVLPPPRCCKAVLSRFRS